MNIYFRVNLDNQTGIGHIVRSTVLASKIKSKNKIKLFLDSPVDYKINTKVFDIEYLYEKKEKFNIQKDIKKFTEITKNRPGIVIIDDYRINNKWINEIKKIHNRIVLFDDNFSPFTNADIIINTKPDFLIDDNEKKYININRNAKLLVGPKYSIINPKPKIIVKSNKFKIMFYLGGSGNIKPFIQIIKNLKENFINFDLNTTYYLVVGPFCPNKKDIHMVSKFKNVKILENKKNIISNYNFINLFVGSSGMSFYENKYYNIPSIFFEMNANQKINLESAKLLGYYLFLKKSDLNNYYDISRLIHHIYKNYKEIKQHTIKSTYQIDNKGADRIANIIIKKKDKNKNLKKKKITTKIKSNVNFSHINEYLHARNLAENMKFSNNKKKISYLEHYNWWFSKKRNSFAYYYKNKILIFVFYELTLIDKKEYLITGWFNANNKNKIDFLTIYRYILLHTNHVEKIATAKKCLPISIINKKNKSMMYLTGKMKWTELTSKVELKKIYASRNIQDQYNFSIYKKNIDL